MGTSKGVVIGDADEVLVVVVAVGVDGGSDELDVVFSNGPPFLGRASAWGSSD